MNSWFKSMSGNKGLRRLGGGVLLVGSIAGVWRVSMADEQVFKIAPPAVDEPAGASHTETVVLAGGCFWGVQGVFQHVNGVQNAVSGYTGGNAKTAQYETVSTGRTGHAESVQITFDPSKVSFGQLLQIYFSVARNIGPPYFRPRQSSARWHRPTSRNWINRACIQNHSPQRLKI
jgi:peptide-methionine (S)-S-oxide reductase